MTPQCGRSVVQVLVVRVDIGVVIYEAMRVQCERSVVQVLFVRVDMGVVSYEVLIPKCGRSVFEVVAVRSDIGDVTVHLEYDNRLVNLGISKQQHLYLGTKNLI